MATLGYRNPGTDAASVMSTTRRDRIPHRRRGTGRETTRRTFGLTGR